MERRRRTKYDMRCGLIASFLCANCPAAGLRNVGFIRALKSFKALSYPFSHVCLLLCAHTSQCLHARVTDMKTGNHTRVDAEQAALKAACSMKARSNSCRGCVSLGAFGVPDYDIQVQTIATEPPYYCVTFQGRHGECLTLIRCHSPMLNMLPCLAILSPVNRT
jgi:hypothetical protein